MLTETEPATLNKEQRSRLHELERVVEHGLSSFIETGRALLEIRESRLYLENYPDFETYLTGRWGMTRSRGKQLMSSTLVAEHLLCGPAAPGGDAPLPQSDQTLQPLTKLEPELQSAVWRLASRISERPSKDTMKAVVQAVETAIANGSHPRKPHQETKKPTKETFLPTVFRLTESMSFSAQLVVLRIDDEAKAKKLAQACGILIERLEALRLELTRRFPNVCFGNLK